MPGGRYDSSKTRVAPVFDQLRLAPGDWVRSLLTLVQAPASAASIPDDASLKFLEGYWGDNERALDPPISLLSWLIRNLEPPTASTTIDANREQLLRRDPAIVAEALRLLRNDAGPSGWYIFEGQTYPDAYLVTPEALIIVEGKRTEPGPTTATTWLAGRHQIWRHIDAAWEIRAHRRVYGLFIVEGDDCFDVPDRWGAAVSDALAPAALASSFPHRSGEETKAISRCLLGATTWQTVCRSFGLDFNALPDEIPDATP